MRFAILILFVSVLPAGVHAAVTDIAAVASSGVQEFLNAQPGSVSSDLSEGDPRAAGSPVRAGAEVLTTQLGGELIGQGGAASSVSDPTPLTASNPGELSVEAACFSNDPSVSYLVTSAVAETRTIRLTRDEIGAGGRAQSLMTISGAVVLWSTDESIPLDLLEGSIEVTITQNDEQVVFEAGLTFVPESQDGFATSGGLAAEAVSLDELARLGVDQDSLDVLEQVASAGRLLVLVIPQQQRRYSYDADANQVFTLTAQMEARLRNAPDGTGIAVVLGRPFADLADFLESGLPGADGQKVQAAVNRALSERSSTNDESAANPPPRPRVCGVTGLEGLFLLFLLMHFLPKSR